MLKITAMHGRIMLVNFIIETYGFKRYLEIGTQSDYCFTRVNAETKVGVDPFQGGTLRMTSDEFFSQNTEKFDVIFIDGDHHHLQVHKDVTNALQCLNPQGFIVMHDCAPPQAKDEHVNRCGTAWRAFVDFRKNPELEGFVGSFDYGVGMITRNKNTLPITLEKEYSELTYEELLQNVDSWLRLNDFDKMKEIVVSSFKGEAK